MFIITFVQFFFYQSDHDFQKNKNYQSGLKNVNYASNTQIQLVTKQFQWFPIEQ